MSQTLAEYNCKAPTFLAGEAFPKYSRLKFNGSGKLIKAAIGDRARMIANREAFAVDDPISVTLVHQAGLLKVVAAGAIAAEATAYSANGGQVSATATGANEEGIVVPLADRPNGGAATAAGDIIVILPTNL